MITREQVADLRDGDLVELNCPTWPSGTRIAGPVWGAAHDESDEDREPYVGPVRIVGSWGSEVSLTVVSRAARPLYVNHPRTEPVFGDIVRIETGEPDDFYIDVFMPRTERDPLPWLCVSDDSAREGKRYSTEAALPQSPDTGRAVLVVDGETRQVLPS